MILLDDEKQAPDSPVWRWAFLLGWVAGWRACLKKVRRSLDYQGMDPVRRKDEAERDLRSAALEEEPEPPPEGQPGLFGFPELAATMKQVGSEIQEAALHGQEEEPK